MQCIGDLRTGVKLKKVNLSKTPIEFELTPYEILMDDIRARNYKLRKVEAPEEGRADGGKVRWSYMYVKLARMLCSFTGLDVPKV